MTEQWDVRALWDFDDPKASEERFDKLISQLEGQDSLRAEALTQRARAQGLQRRFEDARATLEEAKELLKPEYARARISYFLELGRVENSSGNKQAARPHFLRALEIAESVEGEEFLAVDAAHMMAIVEEGDKALEWNERAISMAESAADAKARNWLGSLYNNTGWTYYEMGEYGHALELFQKALEFRKGQGKPKLILIAEYCVGKCFRALGRVDEALEIQLRLEKEDAQDGFVDEEIAECLLLKQDPRAPAYFKKAYEQLSRDEWLMNAEPERVNRLKQLAG